LKGWVLPATWIHPEGLEDFLLNLVKDGSCLNVCCGKSSIGTERIDIDPTSNRTKYGDLFDLSDYSDNSFDYVYCDPPFKIYTSGKNRFYWQQDLLRIARKALITRRPKVNVNLDSVRHEWYIYEEYSPSLSLIRVDWKR
jgi:hypothetical protein